MGPVLRAAAAIAGYFLVTGAAAYALGYLLPRRFPGDPAAGLTPGSMRLVAGALVAGLLWSAAGWKSWREQGWPGWRAGPGHFARGLTIGLAMAAAAVGLELATGGAALERTPEPLGSWLAGAGWATLSLTIAALGEELMFRGFPLARAADAARPLVAAVILTAGFTALHGVNPGVTALGLANIALASLVLAAAFFWWGGLPAAWGLHLGWNAGLGVVVDAPVSGIQFRIPAIEFEERGADWFTGGAFGPEGGLVATVVMAGSLWYLSRRNWRRALAPLGWGQTGERGER